MINKVATVRTLETGYALCQFLKEQTERNYAIYSTCPGTFEVVPCIHITPREREHIKKELLPAFKEQQCPVK